MGLTASRPRHAIISLLFKAVLLAYSLWLFDGKEASAESLSVSVQLLLPRAPLAVRRLRPREVELDPDQRGHRQDGDEQAARAEAAQQLAVAVDSTAVAWGQHPSGARQRGGGANAYRSESFDVRAVRKMRRRRRPKPARLLGPPFGDR